MTGAGGREAGGEADGVSPDEAAASCATALTPRTAALLAYSAWWVTGIVFLVLEPDQPFVRFHARQAFWGLGLIWAVGLAVFLLGFALLVVSPVLFAVAAGLAQATSVASRLARAVALGRSWRGEVWRLPVVGRWAAGERAGRGWPRPAR